MRFLTLTASMLALMRSVVASPMNPTTSGNVVLETLNQTQALGAESLPPPGPPDATPTWPPSATSPAPPRATCTRTNHMFPIERHRYIVEIHNLPVEESIDGLCRGLWDNLKGHWLCTVSSPHGCDPIGDGRTVQWYFHTAYFCNSGMVESAFWGATKNKFGAINPGCKEQPWVGDDDD